MPDADLPLSAALTRWHDVYALTGVAAATMVGLLFVAVSVGSGVFTSAHPAAGRRFFLSATVVNFAAILIVSLIALAPIDDCRLFGGLIGLCGLFGLGYDAHAWRGIVREEVIANVDGEDRVWYGLLPIAGHLLETGAGAAAALATPAGLDALALGLALLIIVGIHNAWDMTLWVVLKKSG